MGFRRFSQMFFILILLFVGINALVWFVWTKDITNQRRNAGDLLRIGYIMGNVSERQNVDDLPKRHIKINQFHGQHVDMVTIGDSFSSGGGFGRNPHYQDYIASLQGLTVLNVPFDVFRGKDVEAAPIVTLSKFINSGYLDVIKPKYLLLESVERYAIQRFTHIYSLNTTAPREEIDRCFREWNSAVQSAKKKESEFAFINNGNWKFIGNNLQYLFSDRPYNGLVYIARLNRRLFSSEHGERLIFYVDDITKPKLATPATVAEANKNLNDLSAILKAKGITLIFMPIVDKLNLYKPYLGKNKYPQSIFFEELRKLPKDYLFIDTKEILSRALEKGELDLFHQDDSHWSCKASEAIFSTIRTIKTSNAAE
jgi:hypothetical protein